MDKHIGRTEFVGFPLIGIKNVVAKVDTGAYSTSIHVSQTKVEDGILKFWIDSPENVYEFEEFKTITVKSSFGKKQKRYMIVTDIKIGKLTYKVHISLSDRKKMKYPVLIGRRFLKENQFMVDVTKKNINVRTKKNKSIS
jgi:hypothetical protein